jgi:hypothetical protein
MAGRTIPEGLSDERGLLDGWLDYYRASLLAKCDGLTGRQLITRSCEPSPMSLIGLVRHMTEMERMYGHRLADWGISLLYCTDQNQEGDFEAVTAAGAAADLETFRAHCARSRQIMAAHQLHDTGAPLRRADQAPASGACERHQFQPRRLSMTTIATTQATFSPTPKTRNAGHPGSMRPVRTLKFCPQNPARKETGRKMVATAAGRRLTTAVCLLASAECRPSMAMHRSSIAMKSATTCCSSSLMSSAYSWVSLVAPGRDWMSGVRAARSRPGVRILRIPLPGAVSR